jgi:hypothetical protein
MARFVSRSRAVRSKKNVQLEQMSWLRRNALFGQLLFHVMYPSSDSSQFDCLGIFASLERAWID